VAGVRTVSDAKTSMEEINANFTAVERTIRRESLVVPIIVSVGYGAALVMVAWQAAFEDGGWGSLSHLITLAFVIMLAWFYWDTDARRRVMALKYETAAGLLDHLVKEYDWKWEECDEAGSVSLHAPGSHEDDDDDEDTFTETEK